MNIDAQAWTNPEGNIDRTSLEQNTETGFGAKPCSLIERCTIGWSDSGIFPDSQ